MTKILNSEQFYAVPASGRSLWIDVRWVAAGDGAFLGEMGGRRSRFGIGADREVCRCDRAMGLAEDESRG